MAARDAFAPEDVFASEDVLAPENTAGPSAAVTKILDGLGASRVSVREVVSMADSHGESNDAVGGILDGQQAPDAVAVFA